MAGTLVQRQQQNGGFTFTELVVTVALALIVTAAVFELVEMGQALFGKGPERAAPHRVEAALDRGSSAFERSPDPARPWTTRASSR